MTIYLQIDCEPGCEGHNNGNCSLHAHLLVKAALWAGHGKAMVPLVRSAAVLKSSQPLAPDMGLGTTIPAAASFAHAANPLIHCQLWLLSKAWLQTR